MAQIDRGYFEIPHPYGGADIHVPAAPSDVHTIVFWSKNFGPLLDGGYGRRLLRQGYNLFFNFTVNSPHAVLEPGVPPLDERLQQMTRLARRFGPRTIQWRFDPICHYRTQAGHKADNLDRFEVIARHAARVGIGTCITSFVDLYRKVLKRLPGSGLQLEDPPLEEKRERIISMARLLNDLGIRLQLCCEKEVLAALPAGAGVGAAACIPNDLLAALYGDDVTRRRDSGQRVAAGCGCRYSRDIGSYRLHPCRHNCLFCYANPTGAILAGRPAAHQGQGTGS